MSYKIGIPTLTMLLAISCTTTQVPLTNQRYVSYADSTAKFFISEKEYIATKSPTTTYFYYHKNAVHHNQGAISGYPLHGDYLIYSNNNNLICKGQFQMGVKDGKWLRWNNKGLLVSVVKYSNGKICKVILPASVKIKKHKVSAPADTARHRWYQLFKKRSKISK